MRSLPKYDQVHLHFENLTLHGPPQKNTEPSPGVSSFLQSSEHSPLDDAESIANRKKVMMKRRIPSSMTNNELVDIE